MSDALHRGVGLYAAGRYWEAHEAWEQRWLESSGGERELLQGLIQAAAAALQAERGKRDGAANLVARAELHLRNAGTGHGVDGPALADALRAWLAAGGPPPPIHVIDG